MMGEIYVPLVFWTPVEQCDKNQISFYVKPERPKYSISDPFELKLRMIKYLIRSTNLVPKNVKCFKKEKLLK